MERKVIRLAKAVPRYFVQSQVKGEFWSEGFVAVAKNDGNAWKRGEFLGSALRVAASGDDAGLRVLAVGAADVCAGFTVGFGGDTARIHNDDISVCRNAFGSA